MHTNYANVSTNFPVDQKQPSKSTMKCSWKVQTISGQVFLDQTIRTSSVSCVEERSTLFTLQPNVAKYNDV